MADLHDTVVDPKLRQEVERPRGDPRGPFLLMAIVATSAMAGAALMGLVVSTQRAAAVAVPAVAPVAVPAVAPVAVPAVAPVAVEAPAPTAPRPCPGYAQKSAPDDAAAPRHTDCL